MARSARGKARRPAERSKRKAPARSTRTGTAGRRRRAASRASAGAARAALPMPPALYQATLDAEVVEIAARTALAIAGAGGPEQEAFARSLRALYGVAYTLKFGRRPAGRDFRIGPLEGCWWAEGAESPFGAAPRETWRWRLRIAVPEDVSAAEVAGAVRTATTRKGGKLEGSPEAARVELERIPAASMGRVLHVGPYADEARSFEKIRAALEATGRKGRLAHLEVYLSDPRRTRPERLETVLLREVGGASGPSPADALDPGRAP